MSTLKTNKISKNLGSNLVIGDGGSDTLSVNATPTFTKNITIENSGSGIPLSIASHASNRELQFTGSASANIAANSGANIFYIQQLAAASMHLQTNSTDTLIIDSAGHITKPLQPSVNGQLTSAVTNATGDATTYYLNNESNSLAHTEIKDVNGDFLNGTFTAPVTGTYLLNGILQYSGIHGTGHNSGIHYIITSNRSYQRLFNPYYDTNVHTNGGLNLTVIADMDSGDTAYQAIYVAATNKTIDLDTASTFMQAFLLG